MWLDWTIYCYLGNFWSSDCTFLGQISRRFLKEEKSFIIPVKTALAILGHFFIDIGRLLLNPSGHMFTYMVHIILLKI